MRHHVAVFSPDFVRGNVLVRRLARDDADTALHDTLASLRQGIRIAPPRVVVFDAVAAAAGEVRSLASLCTELAGSCGLIVLGALTEGIDPALAGLATLLPGALDPEAVALAVRQERHRPAPHAACAGYAQVAAQGTHHAIRPVESASPVGQAASEAQTTGTSESPQQTDSAIAHQTTLPGNPAQAGPAQNQTVGEPASPASNRDIEADLLAFLKLD